MRTFWAPVLVLSFVGCSGKSGTKVGPEVATQQGRVLPTKAGDALLQAWNGLESSGSANPVTSTALSTIVPLLPSLHDDCVAGSGVACWLYHDEYERFLKVTRDERATAMAELDRLCQGNNQVACALAGQSRDDDSGIGGNPAAAMGALKQACDAGLTDACARVAHLRLVSGIEVDGVSEDQARGLRQEACDKGFPSGCRIIPALRGARGAEEDFDLSPDYPAAVRACATGLARDCERLLQDLKPETFGCDRCGPNSPDSRCTDCEVHACREESCCDTCPARNSAECCAEGYAKVPMHPKHAPTLERARAERLVAAAKAGTAEARALFVAGCEAGHARMCLADKVDGGLATFERKLSP